MPPAQTHSITYSKEIPLTCETDVLVAGGGPAGVAASLMVEGRIDSRSIDVRALQARLKAMGAFLPNCK